MVQVTKLSKEELKETGFQNKAIASRFLKTVLNKTPKDFKKKDELINTLKKEYNKMKNFGIDLNETSKIERKVNKVKKTAKKSTEKFEKLLDDRPDIEEIYTNLNVDEYLEKINYKLPTNKSFKDTSKKIKQIYVIKFFTNMAKNTRFKRK
jgi:esterase/lipase